MATRVERSGFNGAALVRARKFYRLPGKCCAVFGLQWGRARASAEIRPGGIKEGRLAVASMGPRSCERGNSFHGGVRLRGDLLQWGRARASAEIPNAVVTALSDG